MSFPKVRVPYLIILPGFAFMFTFIILPIINLAQTSTQTPVAGAAIMRKGENLLYLARKEQCLALATQVKTSFKITDYKIYRIFPSGEVQYLHPKDGVFPEKVNAGRVGVGNVSHSIGKNLNPSQVKFTSKSIN